MTLHYQCQESVIGNYKQTEQTSIARYERMKLKYRHIGLSLLAGTVALTCAMG